MSKEELFEELEIRGGKIEGEYLFDEEAAGRDDVTILNLLDCERELDHPSSNTSCEL